jgi:hypothetical protein
MIAVALTLAVRSVDRLIDGIDYLSDVNRGFTTS